LNYTFEQLCEMSGPELDNLVTEAQNELYVLQRKRFQKCARILHLQQCIRKEEEFSRGGRAAQETARTTEAIQ